MKIIRKLFTIAAFLLVPPLRLNAENFPDLKSYYVNDYAEVINEDIEYKIHEDLKEFREDTGVEFTVVTIASTSSYDFHGDTDEFATALFNNWGVGNSYHNDGVMMLVSIGDRAIRIEMGDGYEQAYNKKMKAIIDNEVLPSFKAGSYGNGIIKGVNAIILTLGDESYTSPRSKKNMILLYIIWGAILSIFLSIGAPIYYIFSKQRRKRKARRKQYDGDTKTSPKCLKCRRLMRLMEGDDFASQLGDIKYQEDRLGTKRYLLWKCPQDGHIKESEYVIGMSYTKCPKCKAYAVKSSGSVNSSTTEYRCQICNYRTTKTNRRSSSSSGRRSGFGGGRSSGSSGASGRW